MLSEVNLLYPQFYPPKIYPTAYKSSQKFDSEI